MERQINFPRFSFAIAFVTIMLGKHKPQQQATLTKKRYQIPKISFAFAFGIQREKILNPGISVLFSLVIVSVRMVKHCGRKGHSVFSMEGLFGKLQFQAEISIARGFETARIMNVSAQAQEMDTDNSSRKACVNKPCRSGQDQGDLMQFANPQLVKVTGVCDHCRPVHEGTAFNHFVRIEIQRCCTNPQDILKDFVLRYRNMATTSDPPYVATTQRYAPNKNAVKEVNSKCGMMP